MTLNDVDETTRQFLLQVFQETNGDTSVQVSMYDIGEALGLDRDAALNVAEALIGLQMVEIRTLSGGIGISPDGIAEMQQVFGDRIAPDNQVIRLGDEPILDQIRFQVVEELIASFKARVGNLGLDFDRLNELMADVKTIDAQLESSRPKAAIIRECLRSLKSVLEKAGDDASLGKIRELLGE
ncbi:MAG: hypothetical protein PVF56_08800 [Desulfobacterales bacterium]|jgi:hypothetical protein